MNLIWTIRIVLLLVWLLFELGLRIYPRFIP